jgi:hypothetical protein
MAMQLTESVNTALGGVSPPATSYDRTMGSDEIPPKLIRQSGWLGANPSPVITTHRGWSP